MYWLGLQGTTHQSTGRSPRSQAKSGDERGPPGDEPFAWRLLQVMRETLAKRGVHALRTLAGTGEPGRRRDRRLLVGVSPAQLETPASKEVGHDLLDAVLALAVHSPGLTFAAARSARSCMTLIAPTVEFISAATSLSEYPYRKRSSRTRL